MLRLSAKTMLFLACAALLTMPIQAQNSAPPKLYKWVDEKGQVHYSERLPQEATGKATTTLNKQGQVTQETNRALTKEELAVKQAEDRRRQDEAKAATEERRKNEAVLSSYESEKDIEMARSRAMESNTDAIKSATHNVERAKRKQTELSKLTTPFKDKPLPKKLERDIEENEIDLKNQQQLLDTKKREAEQINARYDEDKRRFNALTKGTTTSVVK